LAEKAAWNNKAIKSPLIIEGGSPNVINTAIHQTAIGTVFNIPVGEGRVVSMNQTPNVNLQAIEEGNSARLDMDFAAAATEAPLLGHAPAGDSAIKFAQKTSLAQVPLNKWVKADGRYLLQFARKALYIIITEFPPERMERIIGEQNFKKLAGPQINPVTGQMTALPLALPFTVDVAEYDVRIEEKSVSDFNKQQTFNATEALVAGGVPLDDTFRIRNAPIKDTDAALASNEKARNDIMQQMMLQIQMLQAQVGNLEKQVPRQNPKSQGQKGKSASQAGKRSMVGGQTK